MLFKKKLWRSILHWTISIPGKSRTLLLPRRTTKKQSAPPPPPPLPRSRSRYTDKLPLRVNVIVDHASESDAHYSTTTRRPPFSEFEFEDSHLDHDSTPPPSFVSNPDPHNPDPLEREPSTTSSREPSEYDLEEDDYEIFQATRMKLVRLLPTVQFTLGTPSREVSSDSTPLKTSGDESGLVPSSEVSSLGSENAPVYVVRDVPQGLGEPPLDARTGDDAGVVLLPTAAPCSDHDTAAPVALVAPTTVPLRIAYLSSAPTPTGKSKSGPSTLSVSPPAPRVYDYNVPRTRPGHRSALHRSKKTTSSLTFPDYCKDLKNPSVNSNAEGCEVNSASFPERSSPTSVAMVPFQPTISSSESVEDIPRPFIRQRYDSSPAHVPLDWTASGGVSCLPPSFGYRTTVARRIGHGTVGLYGGALRSPSGWGDVHDACEFVGV